MDFKCDRCNKIADGPVMNFGDEEIFGQILGPVCLGCSWAILHEYRDRAEDHEKLKNEIIEEIRRLFISPGPR